MCIRDRPSGGLKMADTPPDTDTTTEHNHSRDGGADQQQSAVRPPSPSDSSAAVNIRSFVAKATDSALASELTDT